MIMTASEAQLPPYDNNACCLSRRPSKSPRGNAYRVVVIRIVALVFLALQLHQSHHDCGASGEHDPHRRALLVPKRMVRYLWMLRTSKSSCGPAGFIYRVCKAVNRPFVMHLSLNGFVDCCCNRPGGESSNCFGCSLFGLMLCECDIDDMHIFAGPDFSSSQNHKHHADTPQPHEFPVRIIA